MSAARRWARFLVPLWLAGCAGESSPDSVLGDGGLPVIPVDASGIDGAAAGGGCSPEFCSPDELDASDDAARDAASADGEVPSLQPVCGATLPNSCGAAGSACPVSQSCMSGSCSDPSVGRSWRTDQNVQSAANDYGARPVLASNRAGSAAVAWDEDSGTELRVAIFDGLTRTWSQQLVASAPAAPNPTDPDVAIDEAGNVYVAWHQGDNTARSMWVNRYDAQTKRFEGALSLQRDRTGFSDHIRLGVDPSGNVLAVFDHSPGTDQGIFAVRYDAALRAWSDPQKVDLPNSSGSSDIDLVVDARGNATLVFVEQLAATGEWQNLYAARFDAGTRNWAAPVRLDTVDTGHDNHPHLDADRFGNVVVTWHQSVKFDSVAIWASRYDAACGRWSDAVRIDDGKMPSSDVYYTDVGLDAYGNALAVWYQRGSVYSAYYRAADSRWLDTGSVQGASSGEEPSLAVDAAGHGSVVFRSLSERILASRFDPQARIWGTPTQIDRGVNDRSFTPRVVVDGQGRVLSVWSQLATQRYKVRSNRFE